MGGSSGGGTTTQTVRTVPDWAIPYVTAFWDQAYALWQADTLAVYTGDVTADQPQDEIDGIAGLANRGRYGDQVITKAIAYEDDVINGGYLGGSKAAFIAALALVTQHSIDSWPSVTSRIGRKPLYVGDPDSYFLAQKLIGTPRYGSGVSTPTDIYNARMTALIYADNFRKERDIQDHGLAYGVEMGKHAAIDGEALRRAGTYQREYLQGTYILNHKLFLEGQEMAVANLEIFGQAIRGLTGSQQTTDATQPGGNKVAAAVGMGMTGAVAGYLIGAEIGSIGGPWGAAIGFAAGAIIGWFAG